MKKPSKLFLAFLILDAIVLLAIVIVAMLPGEFRIERSVSIAAPATQIFSQIDDFHNWEAWSPWAKLDPQCTKTFDGSPQGIGAIFSWSGNDTVGEGRMRLIAHRPPEQIHIGIDFLRPFQATNNVEFTLTPNGQDTRVTWSMTGTRNFLCKTISLFLDINTLVGKDFEKGLAQLKTVVETTKSP